MNNLRSGKKNGTESAYPLDRSIIVLLYIIQMHVKICTNCAAEGYGCGEGLKNEVCRDRV